MVRDSKVMISVFWDAVGLILIYKRELLLQAIIVSIYIYMAERYAVCFIKTMLPVICLKWKRDFNL